MSLCWHKEGTIKKIYIHVQVWIHKVNIDIQGESPIQIVRRQMCFEKRHTGMYMYFGAGGIYFDMIRTPLSYIIGYPDEFQMTTRSVVLMSFILTAGVFLA